MKYFKIRKPLSFNYHRFDIGSPVGTWNGYEDNHFLLKLYKLPENLYISYYEYHLAHCKKNELCNEQEYFEHIYQITLNRIKYFQKQNPFSPRHSSYAFCIEKLQQFIRCLNDIDKWNARPPHLIISEKDELITQQKLEIEELKANLNQLKRYEVAQKIRIEEEHLATLVDLIKQMRELKLPSGRLLLRCDNKSPFSKMISKYFSIGGKDIPTETTRNYFVEKKGDISTKGTAVKLEQQLFKITPVENKK